MYGFLLSSLFNGALFMTIHWQGKKVRASSEAASAADSSSSSATSSDVDTMSSESIKSRGLNSETLEVSDAEYEVLKKNGDIVSKRKTGGKGTTIVEIIDKNGVKRKRQLVIIDEKTAQERANNSVVNNTTNSTATNDTSDASKNSAQKKSTSKVSQKEKANELDAQHKGEIDAENPVDTFIYESVLVSNGSKATSSQQTSSNIAICATGKNYKVFIPRKNKSLSSYANVLKQNSCVNGVLLPGDAILEYNNKVDSAITKANTTFDSIMYFE